MTSSDIETELKAAVPASELAGLRDRLEAMACERLADRSITSTYYDTVDRRLQRQGMALRLRPGDDSVTQTLKSARSASGGLHSVREVEVDLPAGSVPDIGAIPDAALRETVSTLVGRSQLRAVFETRVSRQAGLLAFEDGAVEVALDAGEIAANRACLPVSEAEFEVRAGPASLAYRAAAALLADRAVRLHDASKAERGYRLASAAAGAAARGPVGDGGADGPVRTGTLPATASDWTLDRVEACLAAYGEALAQNIHSVLTSADPEGPHQVRVVLRRLRALLWVAAPAFDPDWAKAQAKAFKALGRAVAPARDADVFVDEIVRPRLSGSGNHRDDEDEESGNAGVADLLARLETWRAETHGAVRVRLREMQASGLALGLLESVASRGWVRRSRDGAAALVSPIGPVAAPILAREWQRLQRAGRKLDKLPAEKRHRLRKDLKRLRYGAELAAGRARTADSAGGADVLTALRRMQTSLGRLNDLDTIAPMRPTLGDAAADAMLAACLGELETGGTSGKVRKHWMAKAKKHWARLQAAATVWELRAA